VKDLVLLGQCPVDSLYQGTFGNWGHYCFLEKG
jgi:hypothetical protein